MVRLVPKHWERFQHYTDRRPPWIKLHHKLLDDSAYLRLPAASRGLAPLLWLLASESDDGSFNGDIGELSFRLRLPAKEVTVGLRALVEAGFFLPADASSASSVLAERKQLAPQSVSVSVPLSLSVQGERERDVSDADFESFWSSYDKKVGRAAAWRAWRRLELSAEIRTRIREAVPRYVANTPDKQFRKHPATWLNGQCWDDEVIKPSNGKPPKPVTHIPNAPLGTPSCGCIECERYRTTKSSTC